MTEAYRDRETIQSVAAQGSGLGRQRVSPAFASEHAAYQKGLGNVCTAKKTPELEHIHGRLGSQVQRAMDFASRLDSLCDRLYGAGPAEGNERTERPQRAGRIGGVEEAIYDMADVLDHIEVHLSRLEDLA
jgi:hypothetical protein